MKQKKDPNIYPEGWDHKKAKAVADYYDAKKDKDVFSVQDTSPLPQPTTWIEVPNRLLPKVRKLLRQPKRSA
ncbi:MAG: hypothetical protein H7144_08860 [Burkholderiales bacterium]|nr:hypothetical protein [Phycisphaerae bacterium]